MGELNGGREAEIGGSLKSKRVQESRHRESEGGSENSIRSVAPARGFGVFNCEGLLKFNLHTEVSYRVVIHSCVTIPHCVVFPSCVVISAFLGGSHMMSPEEDSEKPAPEKQPKFFQTVKVQRHGRVK